MPRHVVHAMHGWRGMSRCARCAPSSSTISAGFRAAARAMLTEAGHDVVGEAADGESTLSVFDAVSPDLVVLDVQLPDTDGFQSLTCWGDRRTHRSWCW